MTIVYLDTETTGLNPGKHEVWELAWAVDGHPIRSSIVAHSVISADPTALEVGNSKRRDAGHYDPITSHVAELEAILDLDGATMCGANPAFDAAFLTARWGVTPWKYRLLDIEAYAMPALGLTEPASLKSVTQMLRGLGHDIPDPDHTATGDVATVRHCHWALQSIYSAPHRYMTGLQA